eukprot:6521256-Pyramimonas_sp.AAC.1
MPPDVPDANQGASLQSNNQPFSASLRPGAQMLKKRARQADQARWQTPNPADGPFHPGRPPGKGMCKTDDTWPRGGRPVGSRTAA